MAATTLHEIWEGGIPIEGRAPRRQIDAAAWRRLADLVGGQAAPLVSLWAESGTVHLAILAKGDVRIHSLAAPEGRFPSVARVHAPAVRLERAICDLHGLTAEGATDLRPWLDHNRWGLRHPLGRAEPAAADGQAYAFREATGAPLHQIPVGPVHAGIIEPGHFRFSANGETVVRLEQRLGYTHKGSARLMCGAPLERAAKLAGRVSGDSTVAYAGAFARAVESALGLEAPPRAAWLRALMGELERLANHLGDIGAVCNDASFSLMHAHCGILRERVLRASKTAFGHRLMMDKIVPGGVDADVTPAGVTALRALLAEIDLRFPALIELFDRTTSLQDRTVGAGILKSELALQYGCGGFVGRASGRNFDARRDLAYAPYPALRFEVAVRNEGDVDARVWVRIEEVKQSVKLIEQILAGLPQGPVKLDLPAGGGEGIGIAEGFRGDILAWVQLSEGNVAHCHLRDPSWFQWPLLEAAIEGNIVADFPLCNKSFNCSYSGHDG